MTFLDHLARLPEIDNISALIVEGDDGRELARIPNEEGKRGSLRVYHALMEEYGHLTPEAARRGLEWFAEKVDEARQSPGSHPNIDRLLDVIENNATLTIRAEY
ncbi:MAG: DUF2322 family protein [Pseudomonadota bacterium]